MATEELQRTRDKKIDSLKCTVVSEVSTFVSNP